MGVNLYPAPSKVLKQQIFDASGTWTYPTSPNFDGEVEVLAVGGGGAGGSIVARSGWTATARRFCTGGGGGGRVTTQKLNVKGLGNQSVVVGAGGTTGTSVNQLYARAGGYSSFGSLTIANAVYDPDFYNGIMQAPDQGNTAYPENTTGALITVTESNTSSGSTTPPTGFSYLVPINISNTGTPNSFYSSFFSVTASVSHTFGFKYARGGTNSTAGTVRTTVYYYNSSGVSTGSSNFSTFTAPTSGTTWTNITLTATPPANSVTARVVWDRSDATANTVTLALSALFATPASTGITEAVYGYTSGYQWLNCPYSSPTVANTTVSVFAQGGGGGQGVVGSSSNIITYLPGEVGWSSGGKLVFSNQGTSADSTTSAFGGCGGGSVTAAEPATPVSFYNGTNPINNIVDASIRPDGLAGQYPVRYFSSIPIGGGNGAVGVKINTDTQGGRYLQNWGKNGRGVDIYGHGGIGGWYTGGNDPLQTGFITTGPVRITPLNSVSVPGNNPQYYNALANTGCGGAGVYNPSFTANTVYKAGNGGSGVVIVRWYE